MVSVVAFYMICFQIVHSTLHLAGDILEVWCHFLYCVLTATLFNIWQPPVHIVEVSDFLSHMRVVRKIFCLMVQIKLLTLPYTDWN